MRFKSQNLQPADCDSIRNPQAAIPIISDPSYKPATHWLRFKSRLWFQSQNLHPAGCDSIRNLQVAIPVPKPASRRLQFNSQPALRKVAIQFATCKLRLPIISDPSYKACNPQVAIRVEVAIPVPKPASRRLRFNSQPASCDSSPKTCIPQVAIQFATCNSQPALRKVAIQFATCKLRFHAQNLHPAGCDSIRNLQPAELSRNLQVAIPIPPKKPATHRLRFKSRLRFQSQNLHPAGCDSNPYHLLYFAEVGANLFWFPFLPLEDPALSCLLCKSSANMSVCVKWVAKMDDLGVSPFKETSIWLLIKIPLSRNGHSSRIKILLSRNFHELHGYLSRGPCWPTTPLMKVRSPPAKLRQRITDHFLVAF